MIIVLHTMDLEPITVVDLPFNTYRSLIDTGRVLLKLNTTKAETVVIKHEVKVAEGIGGYVFLVSEELPVLEMMPTFLPGQLPYVRLIEKGAKL